MFKYIKLRNYKSLVNLDVDFTGKRKIPKKIILIYGENGVGKSNFANAFLTLHETINTKINRERLNELIDTLKKDSFELPLPKEFLDSFKDIEKIIQNSKTINSKGNMILEYGFKIKGKDGVYIIETDNKKIVREKLDFILNKNISTYFDLNNENLKINENIFQDKEYYNEFKSILEKYWGKHSFFALLNYEIDDKANGYIKKKISSNLCSVYKFFNELSLLVNDGYRKKTGILGVKYKLLGKISEGSIKSSEVKELNQMEELLNFFFTHVYSDIKKAYFKREIKGQKINYQLYFEKLIYGELKNINHKIESTGTQKLIELLPFLLTSHEGQNVIIDEFDTGIHDILVDNLIENLSESIKGQIILTTHNTLLLENDALMDYAYVFTLDSEANKKVIPISDFESRLHPNLNLRKRYLKGMYGGVPIPMDIEFNDLAETLK